MAAVPDNVLGPGEDRSGETPQRETMSSEDYDSQDSSFEETPWGNPIYNDITGREDSYGRLANQAWRDSVLRMTDEEKELVEQRQRSNPEEFFTGSLDTDFGFSGYRLCPLLSTRNINHVSQLVKHVWLDGVLAWQPYVSETLLAYDVAFTHA